LMTPHLRTVRIRRWQKIIDATVNDAVDRAAAEGSVEFVRAIAAPIPIRVLGQVVGVPIEDCDLLFDWTNRVVSDDPEFMRSPDEKERARSEMFAYFEDLTEQRRRSAQEDLVSILVRSSIDGEPLTWQDLAAYYFVLIGAGNETTRNLMTGSVLAFEEHPGEYTRLRQDPALVGPAVEELLRYFSPVRAFRRNALRDVEWYGQTIAKGDKVVLWFESANRDERIFPAPDQLILDRSPNEHLAFGWGIHGCMGSHLARAETQTLLRVLNERRLVVRPAGPPDRLHSNQFNGIKRLPVVIEPAPGA
ncbi:MAG TPA: cytochrome P450, partial [Acidimicrobiia bacterium]|nr:cytochrome P450 [Acidimicrobiia bacterium]